MRLYTQESWTVRETRHLLARAGFGASSEMVLRVHRQGRLRAVDALLSDTQNAPRRPYPDWTTHLPAVLLKQYRAEAEQQIETKDQALLSAVQKRKRRRLVRKSQRRDLNSLKHWWFAEMVDGASPLREKLTLFWHDHFPVSARKVKDPTLLYEQNKLFHDHAMGNFRTLTKAVVRDSAMMIYLDANRSFKDSPNENLARELMELFTLGPGHYTEQDIKEAARAMTGYRIDRKTGQSVFRKKRWDAGEKTILGQTGAFGMEEVVDLLFSTPRPATFLAEKLCAYFLGETYQKELVTAVAELLYKHDYELRPALEALFKSREFYQNEVMGTQIKSPLDFYIQLIYQLRLPPELAQACFVLTEDLGLTLYEPPNVAGWNWGQAWITTSTLLARYNYAGALLKALSRAGGQHAAPKKKRKGPPLLRGPARRALRRWQGPDLQAALAATQQGPVEELVTFLCESLFLQQPTSADQAQFVAFIRQKRKGPFSQADLRELYYLMMSSPYYQLT